MRMSSLRIDLQAAFQGLLSLGDSAQVHVSHSEVVVSRRQTLAQADRSLCFIRRFGELLLAQANLSQPEMLACPFPLHRQRPAEGSLRIGPALGAKVNVPKTVLQIGDIG